MENHVKKNVDAENHKTRDTRSTQNLTAAEQAHQERVKTDHLLRSEQNDEWKIRWSRAARNQGAVTWTTPWKEAPWRLYEGLKKHQATALMLLRTEVIGLNAWLAKIRVPNILPRCTCGWHAQTVKHILISCPTYSAERMELQLETHTVDFYRLLSYGECARMTFARNGFLAQFQTANEIEGENTECYNP